MISNRFYFYITLVAAVFVLSSCLDSNDDDTVNYDYSSDAQITSISFSSNQDSMNVLPGVKFSINQVASVPLIFNRDSLPYLFDVSTVKMDVKTNAASGIKLHLFNPDSIYLWNNTDSVEIKKLKHIEVFAANGVTSKLYTFKLNTHQQDPDTIFWQNVTNGYIDVPKNQNTVANADNFYTYYINDAAVELSTTSVDDGEDWVEASVTGLPATVVLSSIQNDTLEAREMWYAMDNDSKVYLSDNGLDWTPQAVDYPVKAIFGKMPSYGTDSVLAVVNDEGVYKFAKTVDFSTINLLNKIPDGFPIESFTSTTVDNPLVYTAKYLVVTGGYDLNGTANKKVWLLQKNEGEITNATKEPAFNVTGSSLFNYDGKIYILTPHEGENLFYTSPNYGMFWERADSKQSLPSEFLYRKNQSVNVDNKNNIWIFGGEFENESQIVDVWKGRINKLFVK